MSASSMSVSASSVLPPTPLSASAVAFAYMVLVFSIGQVLITLMRTAAPTFTPGRALWRLVFGHEDNHTWPKSLSGVHKLSMLSVDPLLHKETSRRIRKTRAVTPHRGSRVLSKQAGGLVGFVARIFRSIAAQDAAEVTPRGSVKLSPGGSSNGDWPEEEQQTRTPPRSPPSSPSNSSSSSSSVPLPLAVRVRLLFEFPFLGWMLHFPLLWQFHSFAAWHLTLLLGYTLCERLKRDTNWAYPWHDYHPKFLYEELKSYEDLVVYSSLIWYIATDRKGPLSLDSKGRFRQRGEEVAPTVDRLVFLVPLVGGMLGFTAIANNLRTNLQELDSWDYGTGVAFGAMFTFGLWIVAYHISIEARAKRLLRYVCSILFVPFVLFLLLIPKFTREIVSPHLHHAILFGWIAAFSRAHTLTSRMTQAVAISIFIHGINFYGSEDLNFFDRHKIQDFDEDACTARFARNPPTDVQLCGNCANNSPWHVLTCGTQYENCHVSYDGSNSYATLQQTGYPCTACNPSREGTPFDKRDWFGRCDQCVLKRHDDFRIPCRSYTIEQASVYLAVACTVALLNLVLSMIMNRWFVSGKYPDYVPRALHSRKDMVFGDAAHTALTWLYRARDSQGRSFPYPLGKERKPRKLLRAEGEGDSSDSLEEADEEAIRLDMSPRAYQGDPPSELVHAAAAMSRSTIDSESEGSESEVTSGMPNEHRAIKMALSAKPPPKRISRKELQRALVEKSTEVARLNAELEKAKKATTARASAKPFSPQSRPVSSPGSSIHSRATSEKVSASSVTSASRGATSSKTSASRGAASSVTSASRATSASSVPTHGMTSEDVVREAVYTSATHGDDAAIALIRMWANENQLAVKGGAAAAAAAAASDESKPP
ncbi:hypothetical protein RI054_23g100530, partial [Pseudoscourfieldia marina]